MLQVLDHPHEKALQDVSNKLQKAKRKSRSAQGEEEESEEEEEQQQGGESDSSDVEMDDQDASNFRGRGLGSQQYVPLSETSETSASHSPSFGGASPDPHQTAPFSQEVPIRRRRTTPLSITDLIAPFESDAVRGGELDVPMADDQEVRPLNSSLEGDEDLEEAAGKGSGVHKRRPESMVVGLTASRGGRRQSHLPASSSESQGTPKRGREEEPEEMALVGSSQKKGRHSTTDQQRNTNEDPSQTSESTLAGADETGQVEAVFSQGLVLTRGRMGRSIRDLWYGPSNEGKETQKTMLSRSSRVCDKG